MTKSSSKPTRTNNSENLPAAAIRALEEAQERREKADQKAGEIPVEIKGRKGPEPVRYGDWEKNGIVSDF